MKQRFFREIGLESEPEEHPIDKLVRRRVGKRGMQAEHKLAVLSAAIVQALEPQSELWSAYEQTKSDLFFAREEAYFDAGVEHGIAAATADNVKTNRAAVRVLARHLAHEALRAGLHREDAAAAAVLAAWSLLSTVRLSKQAR